MQQIQHQNSARPVLIAGSVLVVIGGASLISQLWPDYDRYVPLLVGLALAALFIATRNYVALVGAAIMTGLGVGLVVAQAFPSPTADGAGAVLGLGFGFIAIWVISRVMELRQHHFWPLIPGFILVLVGTGLALDALSSDLSQLLLPVIVLGAGVVLLIGGLILSRRPAGDGQA
jgi:hypothetical protein